MRTRLLLVHRARDPGARLPLSSGSTRHQMSARVTGSPAIHPRSTIHDRRRTPSVRSRRPIVARQKSERSRRLRYDACQAPKACLSRFLSFLAPLRSHRNPRSHRHLIAGRCAPAAVIVATSAHPSSPRSPPHSQLISSARISICTFFWKPRTPHSTRPGESVRRGASGPTLRPTSPHSRIARCGKRFAGESR